MRNEPTQAEAQLWQELRREALGAKFRRQHAIGPFIVDFYCVPARLVIEVDGPIHDNQQAYDHERQEYLEALGLAVIRFTNAELLEQMATVLTRIAKHIQTDAPSPRKERELGGEVTPNAID